MQDLIQRICERLQANAYVNEAAISHGVVTPILGALGWDSADPHQLVPEYTVGSGRVDFALIGLNKKPGVFIEVKAVGKATDADRQLFEYAFHQGVPLCVLTDGREWSFYLPSGTGSYDDRRVYRLQLDERPPAECEKVFQRYLARDRVRSGAAFADAQQDHQTAAGRREARALLPRAWADLVGEGHELLVDLVAEKAEALSGYRPDDEDVATFLRKLQSAPLKLALDRAQSKASAGLTSSIQPRAPETSSSKRLAAKPDKTVRYTLFGRAVESSNASQALVAILRALAQRDEGRVSLLAAAVRTPRLAHIARSPAEINPRKPSIARAVEISPGWMVGLNIDNRTKMQIIRTACAIWSLSVPDDLDIRLPNA